MEALVIGVAASLNFMVIYLKVEHKRIPDAILDGIVLFLLATMFGHSTGGMVIATIASAVISVFLFMKNPKLPIDQAKIDDFLLDFKSRMPR